MKQNKNISKEKKRKEKRHIQLITDTKLMNSASPDTFKDWAADFPIVTNCCNNKMTATKELR
jgi:hypothetical protein